MIMIIIINFGGEIMLSFKPLNIEDRELFNQYLIPYTFSTCEYSFTNLFIWRKGCDIQYTIYKGALIIKKRDFNYNYHFMQPVGYKIEDLKDIVEALEIYREKNKMEYLFKDCEEGFLNDLGKIYGDRIIIEEDRDNFDYIYDSGKLISLSGKNLHSKKNHYNAFVKKYNYRVEPLTRDKIKDCILAAREWCSKNECKGYLLHELKAIEELLCNMNDFSFKGMIVYVDNKISAFTIGEKLNEKMAVIHIEKADYDIRGLYAFINKTFVENNFKDVELINREQDLGIEGLRMAKESYHPLKLEKKYIINLNK